MAPKVHRGPSGQFRTHSRSSSTSKIAANLQFTQKEVPKQADKTKKVGHEAPTKPVIPRINSSQRIQSREQLQALTKQRPLPPPNPKNGKAARPGFSITSPGEEDDEDAWVSSESGAATPNHNDSGSDTASDDDASHIHRSAHVQQRFDIAEIGRNIRSDTPLVRVDTARPSDFAPKAPLKSPVPPTPAMTALPSDAQRHSQREIAQQPQKEAFYQLQREAVHTQPYGETHQPRNAPSQYQRENTQQSARHAYEQTQSTIIPQREAPDPPHFHSPSTNGSRPEASSEQHSPRLSHKRYSSTRPPSTHSISSRTDPVRPHPLIRGQSHGFLGQPSKPSPLTPLTVISDTRQDADSLSSALNGKLSTSPASTRTIPTSPGPDTPSYSHNRRTSFSSTHSIATAPVHATILRESQIPHDRHRTFSTMSASSSSAALSSLVHLPTVTRPPSPQTVTFFPPINPHVNIEAIHPLLPGPYLNNHLTVLVRRTPIWESFDRVSRAKQQAAR